MTDVSVSTLTVITQTMRDPAIVVATGAVLTALLKLALLGLAGVAGRLLNTMLHVENSTWKQKIALRLVCYAQNTIMSDQDKQAYVSRQLSKLLGNRVDPEEIQHLLEEAVIKMQTLTNAKVP